MRKYDVEYGSNTSIQENEFAEGRIPGEKRSRRKKRKSLAKRAVALMLSASLFGGTAAAAFRGANWIFDSIGLGTGETVTADGGSAGGSILAGNGQNLTGQDGGVIRTSTVNSGGMDVSDIASATLPAVVAITNISVQEVKRYYRLFGRYGQWATELEETESAGSGVIIAQDDSYLYIVTNNHVVDGAMSLSVSFVDDAVYSAAVCGTDSNLDLAVVKMAISDLSDSTKSQIAVISVGSSDELQVGEQVVAIGNAMGYGQSVTTGIVSALNRTITTGTDSSGNPVTSTYIQTDAAINPGNSGGTLLNMDGQLIGINTAKVSLTEIEGMGYAIPVSRVWGTILELMGQTSGIRA